MLEGRDFDTDMLSDLARQSAGRLRALLGERAETAQLTDTFEVWALGAKVIDRAAKEGRSIDSAATFTERFHHQVEAEGNPVGFIRSKLSGDRLMVTEVHVSRLAQRIETALARTEFAAQNHVSVRLLAIPAYYLHAMMVKPEDSETNVLILGVQLGGRMQQEAAGMLSSAAFFEYLLRIPRPEPILMVPERRERR